jgi:H+-transporting ATPase
VLIIFLNDFLTMALTTDRMSVSRRPNLWHTRSITVVGVGLGLLRLAFTFGVFLFGVYGLRLESRPLQTLTFAAVILSSQAGVYLLRERGPCWSSWPSRAMLGSTALGLAVTAFIALSGWHVPAIPLPWLGIVAGVTVGYFFALDWIKVWMFHRWRVR